MTTAPGTGADQAPEEDPDRTEDSAQAPESVPAPEPGSEAPAEPVADAGETAAPEPGSTPSPDSVPGDAAAPPATGAAAGQASLVIRVSEDCWLMIREAEQRLVYRDLAAGGTVLELSALPPIRVVAGYAHGIEVEFNGNPFDLSPFSEQDTGTARFRLGS